jgi:acyl-CoA-binding protein
MIKEAFEKAVAESKQLNQWPGNDSLLEMYSLYKQATVGDAPAEGPSNPFDFVGVAKHGAWLKLTGTSAEDAMQRYIALIDKLKNA